MLFCFFFFNGVLNCSGNVETKPSFLSVGDSFLLKPMAARVRRQKASGACGSG